MTLYIFSSGLFLLSLLYCRRSFMNDYTDLVDESLFRSDPHDRENSLVQASLFSELFRRCLLLAGFPLGDRIANKRDRAVECE